METSALPFEPEEFISLNVGGVVYQTTGKSLRRYPGSTLSQMDKTSPQDKSGNYLIDGDGALFRHVLRYLRTGKLGLPTDFKECRPLLVEAGYYRLTKMQAAIREVIDMEDTNTLEIIEVFEQELMECSTEWRIFGSKSILAKIPVLRDYGGYCKGSQSLEFLSRTPGMAGDHKFFPKTTLFRQIAEIGFKFHSTDSIDITQKPAGRVPWLRYVFVREY